MVRLVFIAVFLVGMVVSIPAGTTVFSISEKSTQPKNGEVSVYPNPFLDQITIDLSKFSSKNIQIAITDVLGEVIFEKFVTDSETTIINLEDKNLKPGIYIVSLKSMEQSISKRIVKK